ncbi:MAG: hypothetical protein KKH98_10250, partial [Spirochaetes bacterium]|nr:hypothetical protein [Spirochaetota bacterium]
KYLKIIFFMILVMLVSCGRFRKVHLTERVRFTLPVSGENSVQVIRSSEFFIEAPSSYYLKKNKLYIINRFNNTVLEYNKKNEIVMKLTNKNTLEINPVLSGSNQVLQPFSASRDLFSFRELDKILVSDNAIYLESILQKNDVENQINAYSLILKYDLNGEMSSVIGSPAVSYSNSNKFYPFVNLVKFSIDDQDNIFVYSKIDENWEIVKLDKEHNLIYRFRSYDLLQKFDFKKKENEKIVLENIDNSKDGTFLIFAVTYFKDEVRFKRTVFYRLDIATDKITRLFRINDENLNFVYLDNSHLLYLWETEEMKNNKETVIMRIYTLSGRLITNYYLRLDRSKAQWFGISMQKDRIISGINIIEDKLNVVEWK